MTVQFIMSRVYKTIDDNGTQRNINRNQLVIIEDNAALVNELVRNQEAEEVPGDHYRDYNARINACYRRYKQQIDKIQQSNDPIYDVEKNGTTKRYYDIKALRIDMESEVRAIEHEYDELMHAAIQEAKKSDALAVTLYTPADESLTKALVNKFKINALTNYDDAKQTFKDSLEQMTLEQLTALSLSVDEIKSVIYANEQTPALAAAFFGNVVDRIQSAQPISKAFALEQLHTVSIGDEYRRGNAILQASYGRKEKQEAKLKQ